MGKNGQLVCGVLILFEPPAAILAVFFRLCKIEKTPTAATTTSPPKSPPIGGCCKMLCKMLHYVAKCYTVPIRWKIDD